jgi:Bacterial Ig domain
VNGELFGKSGGIGYLGKRARQNGGRAAHRRMKAAAGACVETLEERQLLSLTIDVRAADDVSKSATVTTVGTVLNLDVWATITGTMNNAALDALQSVHGSFLSTGVTTGDVGGNLTAANVAPFAGLGSQPGSAADLNGDGNLDWGSNVDNTTAGFFIARADSLEYSSSGTVVGGSLEFKIGTLTYTVTKLNEGGETDITFRPRRPAASEAIAAEWFEDSTYKNNLDGTFQGGAPFKISDPAIAPAPTAVNDTLIGVKNTASTFNVLANDVFVEPADPTTVMVISGPTHGTAVPQSNGTILYTPLSGFFGNDSFTYTVADTNNKTSNVATANITVLPFAPPVPVADTATTAFNTADDINVISNDTLASGATVTSVAVATAPAHGTAVVQSDNSILYTPTAGFHGSDTFTYNETDSNGESSASPATVTVTVSPPPAPVANNDTATTQVSTADTINVIGNDTLAPGATVTSVAIATAPTHGTAVVQSNNSILYTPTTGYTGGDSFTYNETDSNGETSATPGTVTVNVVSTPAPVATNDTANMDPNVATDINVLANDTAATGTTLVPSSVVVVTSPADGTAVVQSDGTILYTPTADFIGHDSFTYTVNQSDGQTSNVATVSVAVETGAPPTANNDSLTALANTANTLNVLANDVPTADNTLIPSSVVIGTAPVDGTAVAQTDGTIVYTPNAGFVGTDSLTYTVDDTGGGISNTATVDINVGSAITVAKGATRTLNYTDANGVLTTITLNKGTADIFFGGTGTLTTLKGGRASVSGTSLAVTGITLTGTTKASALSIQSKHGSATIGGISDSSALGSITAPTGNLNGVLTVGGATAITLGQVSSGSLLSIGATSAGVVLSLGTVADSTINSAVPIRLLKLKSWTNTLGDGQNIKAPAIGSIVDNGAFEPDMTLSGAAKPAIPTLASANIHGALDGGTWAITGNVGSIVAGTNGAQWAGNISGKLNSFVVRSGGYSGTMTIGGILGTMSVIGNQAGTLTALSARAIHITGNMNATFITLTGTSGIDLGSLVVNGAIDSNSSVTAASSINTVVAGSLTDSTISAGITSGTTLTTASSSTLGSSFIRGVHLTQPVKKEGFAFSNSAILARTIDSAVVGKVNTLNNFVPEGLAAVIFKSVTGTLNGGTGHLGPKQLATEADVTAFFAVENVIPGDFEIDVAV